MVSNEELMEKLKKIEAGLVLLLAVVGDANSFDLSLFDETVLEDAKMLHKEHNEI